MSGGFTVHMCLSIRGALMNWRDSDNVGVFKHNDGRPMSPLEAKAELLELLANGHEKFPLAKCDLFDKKTGCPGHPVVEETERP